MEHTSVLLAECIQALEIRPDGLYLDATVGLGGHSEQIAKRLDGGRLIGLDRDKSSLARAAKRLEDLPVTLAQSDFRRLASVLDAEGCLGLDGALFDLGVSSPQLDEARGFSYMRDEPLDMRMNRDDSLTAYVVVNAWPRGELMRILREYGEERYALSIAAAIVRARERALLETTGQLVEVIRSAMPARALGEHQHPAKRSFQAIRIAVNDELNAVREGVQAAIDRLNPGGVVAVISFHSLEDRIVKHLFVAECQGCTCPPSFPVCVCGKQARLTRTKPILPSETEIQENPRARSAKLRVARRI